MNAGVRNAEDAEGDWDYATSTGIWHIRWIGSMVGRLNRKTVKVSHAIRPFQGGPYDPHLLAFFHSFNRQEFYHAHDILESLWLQDRHGPNGDFYKGLIQLAGAFVHVQKARIGPALALFRLARANLAKYSPSCDGLVIHDPMLVIEKWETFLIGNGVKPGPPDWPVLNPR